VRGGGALGTVGASGAGGRENFATKGNLVIWDLISSREPRRQEFKWKKSAGKRRDIGDGEI
jgi:hypothetical protein